MKSNKNKFIKRHFLITTLVGIILSIIITQVVVYTYMPKKESSIRKLPPHHDDHHPPRHKDHRPPHHRDQQPHENGPRVKFINPLLFSAIIVVTVVILTSLLSTLLTFRAFGKFYEDAKDVVEKIKKGDFSARFDIKREDEIGNSMFAFNEMAQEIEKYVNTIKASESNRIHLLQELAHDLRTPIASLKNTISTLSKKRSRMSEEQKEEFFELATNEMDYFEKLVEDLLFLAKMSEPKYDVKKEHTNIVHTLNNEIDRFDNNHSPKIKKLYPKESIIINADKHLFQRLIRNALENSMSFTKEELRISLTQLEDKVIIDIIDDGDGFREEVLKEFGKRKISRYISGLSSETRVSVGLGSVIMNTIMGLHNGKLQASNQVENGAIIGAKISFIFPLSDKSPYVV